MPTLTPSPVGRETTDSGQNLSLEATGGTQTHNLSHCSRVLLTAWPAVTFLAHQDKWCSSTPFSCVHHYDDRYKAFGPVEYSVPLT